MPSGISNDAMRCIMTLRPQRLSGRTLATRLLTLDAWVSFLSFLGLFSRTLYMHFFFLCLSAFVTLLSLRLSRLLRADELVMFSHAHLPNFYFFFYVVGSFYSCSFFLCAANHDITPLRLLYMFAH